MEIGLGRPRSQIQLIMLLHDFQANDNKMMCESYKEIVFFFVSFFSVSEPQCCNFRAKT